MENSKYDMIVKIVLIGDSGVGKTNVLLRYVKNQFDESAKATIGMDFTSKEVDILDKNIKAQFWDTAGQEKYRSIAQSYYKLADGVMLVYDVSRKETFERVKMWLDELKENITKQVKIILIGNKNDLVDNKTVSTEEGKSFAEEHDMFFWETSALTNDDNCVMKAVDTLLEECAKDMIKKMDSEDAESYVNIRKNTKVLNLNVDPNAQNKKSCC